MANNLEKWNPMYINVKIHRKKERFKKEIKNTTEKKSQENKT